MEAAAAGVAARGVSLPVSSSSQPSRKQWRAVPEQSGRNSGGEEFERAKMGQSDERLIYEVQQGREPADVDFCSITIDANLDNDILQQRLHHVVKQREELQQMEFELRAQLIARTEVMEMQNTFDAQIKEHVNANSKLQEQLHEREQKIVDLERKMEEKDRELHAIRLANEAAWAKEDLLREQSKELQSYRRERDNSEAERVQHIKQIHDLQEHIQEKERQFMELQEQNRVAQDTILFKDEQLREAQAWISRVQEMDALQSSTNHSLQAQLRDRSEQYNQLWLGCQRQFAEMERLHLHIQQLQLELAEAKERNQTDGSQADQTNSKEASHVQSTDGQMDAGGNIKPNGSSSDLPSGNAENASPFVSGGNALAQSDQVHGVALAPSSLLSMPTYLPPGQVAAFHPFFMHQQGVPHSVPSHILQQLQNQQAVPDGSQIHTYNQYPPPTPSTLSRSESNYSYEASGNGQSMQQQFPNVNANQDVESNTVVPSSKEDREFLQNVEQISSQFHGASRLDSQEMSNEDKAQGSVTEESSSTATSLQSEAANPPVDFGTQTLNASSGVVLPEAFASSVEKNPGVVGKPAETPLLDERSLLACIVRTIPPGSGGRIRISSTLPNRLAKMLAPLHWHDYKKKYGKLDDFVASHPELFVIDGDYIQLRDGAKETIAATAAFAKVAAVAASTHSSMLPSVAVTPMAQSHRLKKALSMDTGKTDNCSRLLETMNQCPSDVSFNVAGGNSNVKILSKPKDHTEQNGSESRSGQSILLAAGKGANFDRNSFSSSRSKVSVNGGPMASTMGKQQSRAVGGATSSRR